LGTVVGVVNKITIKRKDARSAATAPSASTRVGDVWKKLVEGRLPVMRFYERAGRRYLVLATNGGNGELTPRQRQIVAFRSYGETTKHVAHELGVSEPTVIREIGTALKKLGLSSEVELPLLFGAALRSGRRA
jgi:DNA-binding NarL/FixJ family response regulator